MTKPFFAPLLLSLLLGAGSAEAFEHSLRDSVWRSCHLDKCYELKAKLVEKSALLNGQEFAKDVELMILSKRNHMHILTALKAPKAMVDEDGRSWVFLKGQKQGKRGADDYSFDASKIELQPYHI